MARILNRRTLPVWLAALVLAVGIALLPQAEAGGEVTTGLPSAKAVSGQVDQMIAARLKTDDVTPAPLADDATFLRRVYLDVIGTVPKPQAVEAFVKDRTKDKRTRKIDELLAHEGYADYWSMVWYRTLTGLSVNAQGRRQGQGARALQGAGGKAFHKWLEDQLDSNRPYNEMVFDMLTATGRTDENGAAVYYARWEGNANNTIGAVSRQFLGLQIQCAQCHDHIYEDTWKQDDFKGMAAFFAATRQQRVPEYRELQKLRREMQAQQQKQKQAADGMDGPTDKAPTDKARGMSRELRQKMMKLAGSRSVMEVEDFKVRKRALGQLERRASKNPQVKERIALMRVKPKLWHGAEMDDIPGISRRYLLGRWITADDNPYFARALSNRIWGTLLGTGFVNPLDDFNSFNEPSHPEILALLSKDFIASKYDLKRMLRIVLNTETYQRSAEVTEGREVDPQLFAHAKVRQLTTDQLPFALIRAIGLDDASESFAKQRRAGKRIRELIARSFTFVFDDDEGAEAEDFEGSIPQGLFLMNGQLMSRLAARRKGPMDMMMRRIDNDEARIEHLYMATYGREPTRKERSTALKFVRDVDSPSEAYGDLLWALVNSAEFMTNH